MNVKYDDDDDDENSWIKFEVRLEVCIKEVFGNYQIFKNKVTLFQLSLWDFKEKEALIFKEVE